MMKVYIGLICAVFILCSCILFVNQGETRFEGPHFKPVDEARKDGQSGDHGDSGVDMEEIMKSPALRRIYEVLQENKMENRWHDKQVIMFMKHKNMRNCDEKEPYIDHCHSYPKRICVFVCDMLFYNVSDVVVFNVFYDRFYPKWRPDGQKWAVYDLEAPPQSMQVWAADQFLGDMKYNFNISSMMSSDSKVPFSLLPKYFINWSRYKSIKNKKNDFAANKTKSAVWLCSHCETQSERESYVQELQKYIDVDIFGVCGKKMCTGRGNRMTDCEVDLLNQYHFYLSFENSMCENYVTEKLLKVYGDSMPMVPVVMGLPKYSSFLPHTTYLDVLDYASPEDMASRMRELMKNKNAYNEFVARKMSADWRPVEGYPCRLCDYVHESKGKTETIEDLTSFWSIERRCKDPRSLIPGSFWDYWKQRHLVKRKD